MTSVSQPSINLAIEGLGFGVDLSISGSLAEDAYLRVADAWSGALRPFARAERVLRVRAGVGSEEADLADLDLDVLLHNLSQLVTQTVIEERAGDLMMFHAAGLAHPSTGATVALVAPSGTGKTTVSRLLGQSWGYVSDETVGFDESLTVLPYRKPLSVLQGTGYLKAQESPERLGLREPPAHLALTAVVLLERDAAVDTVEVEEVRTVAALPLLAEQTSYLTRHEQPLHRLADALEATGGLRLVRYRSAEDLAALVGDLIGEPA